MGAASVVIVGAILWAALAQLPVYSIAPGLARPVTGPGGLVEVPASRSHAVSGRILMTDVYLGPVSPLEWLVDHLRPDVRLVPSAQVLGTLPASQLQPVELTQMAQSERYAAVAALRALGYRVPTLQGPVVVFVAPGSPAASLYRKGMLGLGWTLTAVDGTHVSTAASAASLIGAHPAGATVRLTFDPGDGTPSRVLDVRLARLSGGARRAEVGIGLADQPYWNLPFPVKVNSDGIGGPSAGLAFTLGIIDELSNGDLTGGRSIAATGTIAPTGAVGDVGGVQQKAVAVRRAGATVFLVPPQELAAARSGAAGHLRVVPVSTLGEALRVLRSLGGHVSAGVLRRG